MQRTYITGKSAYYNIKRLSKDKGKKIQVLFNTCHVKSGISDMGGGIYIYSAELEQCGTISSIIH